MNELTFFITSQPSFSYAAKDWKDRYYRTSLSPSAGPSGFCNGRPDCVEIAAHSTTEAASKVLAILGDRNARIAALIFPENRCVQFNNGAERHQAVGEGNHPVNERTLAPLAGRFAPDAAVDLMAELDAPGVREYGQRLASTLRALVRITLSRGGRSGETTFREFRPGQVDKLSRVFAPFRPAWA